MRNACDGRTGAKNLGMAARSSKAHRKRRLTGTFFAFILGTAAVYSVNPSLCQVSWFPGPRLAHPLEATPSPSPQRRRSISTTRGAPVPLGDDPPGMSQTTRPTLVLRVDRAVEELDTGKEAIITIMPPPEAEVRMPATRLVLLRVPRLGAIQGPAPEGLPPAPTDQAQVLQRTIHLRCMVNLVQPRCSTEAQEEPARFRLISLC